MAADRRPRAGPERLMAALAMLAVACAAAWLGVMAFFSFSVAPLVFTTVERAVAGQIVGAVFPRYYVTGIVLSTTTLLLLLIAAAGSRGAGRWFHGTGAFLAATMVLTLGLAYGSVLPQTTSARAAGDAVAFAAAHRTAVRLNGLTMLAGVAVLLVEVVSAAPRRARSGPARR